MVLLSIATNHVAYHALFRWLSCTDHVADHTLITWLSWLLSTMKEKPMQQQDPAQPKNKLKNVKSHYSQAVTPPLLQNSFCQVMTPFISLLGKFLKRISIFTVSNFFPPIPLKIYFDLHHFCCKIHWSILILLDPSAPHHTVELCFTRLAFSTLHVFRVPPPSLVSP